MNNPQVNDLSGLAGRILLAILFLVSGWSKITGYGNFQTYMTNGGVSASLLPLVIITEIGGGLLIALGWQTRLVAVLLAGFTILTALFFHASLAQQTQFMKNLSIAGGFCMLFVAGPGRYSLDAMLARKSMAS